MGFVIVRGLNLSVGAGILRVPWGARAVACWSLFCLMGFSLVVRSMFIVAMAIFISCTFWLVYFGGGLDF